MVITPDIVDNIQIPDREYVIERPEVSTSTAYSVIKRSSDIVFSLVGIIVLFLPMLLIAIIIVMDSKGSPIFRQERLGKNGIPFNMYKFRSMVLDAEAEGPRWADENDERCTRFGRILRKTRLDELPQLYNILRGDMSFVGPRPERAFFYERFELYIHGFKNRLMVTPGLTGYAQVSGGYLLLPEEKIVYDMEYIKNQSLGMDIRCLLKTFNVLLTGKGSR